MAVKRKLGKPPREAFSNANGWIWRPAGIGEEQKKGDGEMELIAAPYHLNDKAKNIQPILSVEKTKIINIQLQPGETVPEHAVDADVAIIARSGKVNFTVEGKTVEVSPQQVLYMAPLEKHSLAAVEASDLMVVQTKR